MDNPALDDVHVAAMEPVHGGRDDTLLTTRQP